MSSDDDGFAAWLQDQRRFTVRPAVRLVPWDQLSPRERFHALYRTVPMLAAPPARADYPAGGRGLVDFESAVLNWLDRHRPDSHELLDRTRRRPPEIGHPHDQRMLAFALSEALLADHDADALKAEYQRRYLRDGRAAANGWIRQQVWPA